MGSWLAALVIVCAGCEKKQRSPDPTPQPVQAPAAPARVTPVDAQPAVPIPENPGTSLRIRTVVVTGGGGPRGVNAMCRTDEQLTGGVCDAYHEVNGFPVDANLLALATDGHTFGAGWRCVGATPATATAFCLSDSASPRPPVEK